MTAGSARPARRRAHAGRLLRPVLRRAAGPVGGPQVPRRRSRCGGRPGDLGPAAQDRHGERHQHAASLVHLRAGSASQPPAARRRRWRGTSSLQALYTWREAFIGFALGAFLGIALATAFVHFGLIERALVPYVVASQTIPIVALAPLIIYLVGHNVSSVVIIATYLSFYPVTIAMLRGLRSPDPRALELMRSYAAGRWAVLWKVRFPASLPYLFTALKITATASIVGAIVGEGPGGIQAGLGRAHPVLRAAVHRRRRRSCGVPSCSRPCWASSSSASCAGRRCGFCATAPRQRPDDRGSRRNARRSS